MNLKIKTITLENFKGTRQKTINLNESATNIMGANGSGKTTIATAYHWVFANTDYDLKSNPPIFPIDIEECTPSVEIEMLIDDKPVKVAKRQTRKVTESNGVKKVALTNNYYCNDVPMSERDFQKKLVDMGFDFEKFSTLTNPNAFLAEKKDVQRKILFSMASAHTDYEIASTMDGVSEAAELLKNYSVDEIKAMENATLKKITENYGKKGEILNSKIEGLEMSKVDLDFAELELQKNGLQERLEKNQDAQRVGNLIEEELNKLREQDMKVQFELSGIKQKEEAEERAAKEKILADRTHNDWRRLELESDIKKYQSKIAMCDININALETEKNGYADKINQIKAKVFDENSTFCPVCHRVFESDKIAEMKIHFEKDKENQITTLIDRIDEVNNIIAVRRMERDEIESEIKKAMNDKAEIETTLKKPVNALEGNMEKPNLYGDEKDRLTAELENITKQIEIKKAGMPNMEMLKAEELNLHGELRDCEIQLSKADDNCRIDEKIEELRKQQIEFEQNRANAEKILYELDEIQKQKNQLITDEINKNFEIVKFLFFTYLKNGSYTEACIATVNGKELGASVNTGLEIRAKLDIIRGLQKFYDLNMPVFLDQAEALDDTSLAQIKMDNQMVYLTVTNDSEITIKEV